MKVFTLAVKMGAPWFRKKEKTKIADSFQIIVMYQKSATIKVMKIRKVVVYSTHALVYITTIRLMGSDKHYTIL